MRFPTLTRVSIWSSILLGLVSAPPCLAATTTSSSRPAVDAGRITGRAGWMRIERARAEIAPTAPARRHAAPPYAAVPSAPPADRYFSETRPDRPSSSRDHVSLARTAVARLRTTALPDRRARTAVLAALAGIFHEAHAPPLLS